MKNIKNVKNVEVKEVVKNYSYLNLIDDLYTILDNVNEDTLEQLQGTKQVIIDKIDSWQSTLIKKAEYSANHPKKSKNEISPKTQDLIEKIKEILKTQSTPISYGTLNNLLGGTYKTIQLVGAVEKIDGIVKSTIIEEVVNNKGLKSQVPHIAISLNTTTE